MYQNLMVQDLSDEELEMVVGGGHHHGHSHGHSDKHGHSNGHGGNVTLVVYVTGNNDNVNIGVSSGSNGGAAAV